MPGGLNRVHTNSTYSAVSITTMWLETVVIRILYDERTKMLLSGVEPEAEGNRAGLTPPRPCHAVSHAALVEYPGRARRVVAELGADLLDEGAHAFGVGGFA